jgi:hypothetical protein
MSKANAVLLSSTSLTHGLYFYTRKKNNANMTSTDRVLVYHHRHNDSNPIIPNGLAVITTSELDSILQNRKSPCANCSDIVYLHTY